MHDHTTFNLHWVLADQERRIYSKWCQKRGISPVNMQLLSCIANAGDGADPSGLAEEMVIPRQTMTGLLDQLERKKLIRRVRDSKDRRKVHIYLENEGKAMLNTVLDELRPHEIAVMQTIDEEEFRIFNKVYNEIVDKLSRQLISED